jgi:AraC-like DNA-binding protein
LYFPTKPDFLPNYHHAIMNSPSVNFRAPGQTDPAIFVGSGRFAAGAGSSGCFDQWVLGHSLEGHCHWRSGAGEFRFAEGDVWLVRAGGEQFWRVPPQPGHWHTVYAVFHARLHWLPWLNAYEHAAGCGIVTIAIDDAAVRARVRRGLLRALRLYGRGVSLRDEWAMAALERVLLTLRAHALQRTSLLDERVQGAVAYLHAHYAEPLSIEMVAHAACLSVSQLSLLFGQGTGLSPMRYLDRLRLERAADQLAFTAAPIAGVARSVGFNDPEYFARRFRAFSGSAPRAWRQAQRAAGRATSGPQAERGGVAA